MKKYMFMNGPFKGQVIQTQATLEEMNSKPNIEIKFVAGPFEGLVTQSVLCYDRKMVEAREVYANVKPTYMYSYSMVM